MKHIPKVFPLILIAALLCTSCSEGEKISAADTADTTAAETVAAPTYIDNLSEDIDLGGYNVRVFGTTATSFNVTAEDSADTIKDLLYKRNLAIEDRFHTSISYIPYSGNAWEVFVPMVQSSVMAGTDDYDVITDSQWVATPLTFNNTLLNLNDVPYIEPDAAWWASDFIDGYAYKDTMYWLTGPLDLSWINTRLCNYVNLRLWNNLFPDEDIYQIVDDGKWTLDTLNAYATETYRDLNGNGVVDEEDQIGCAIGSDMPVERFALGAGVRVTEYSDAGELELAISNDPAPLINFWEKLYKIRSNSRYLQMTYRDDWDCSQQELHHFTNGNMLFVINGWLGMSSGSLRNMEDDYGIIPYPKYDETQPNYVCGVVDHINLYALPTTVTENGRDAALVVLEAAAAEGYNTITPAYYEDALKNKYIRDERSVEIINMLSAFPVSDFGAQYLELGFVSTVRGFSGANAASKVASYEKRLKKNLESLIESLESAE